MTVWTADWLLTLPRYQFDHILRGDNLPESDWLGSLDVPNLGCCQWNRYVELCCYCTRGRRAVLTMCQEYFLASWIAVFTIEKSGRRPLMLLGAAGMSFSMVMLAVSDPA